MTAVRAHVARLRTRLRRALLTRRRLLAALLATAAVAAGLHALAPPAPAGARLTVAARDLPAGRRLAPGDLEVVTVPPGGVPDGARSSPVGETLAAPVRRGEPITDLRLLGATLAPSTPGLVAVPVRLPDAGVAGLLRPGERVDLLATDPVGGTTQPVAADVVVLAVPPEHAAANTVTDAVSGRLVVVGVPETDVTGVTNSAVRHYLTVAFRH